MTSLFLLWICKKYFPNAFATISEIIERIFLAVGIVILLLLFLVGIRELPLHMQDVAGKIGCLVCYLAFLVSGFYAIQDQWCVVKDFFVVSDEP